MPELPEVETTLRGIEPHLLNQTIQAITLRRIDLRWPISPEVSTLRGQTIVSLVRRGKYILIHFSQGTLMLHLGMSGNLRVLPSDTPIKKHDHVDILLSNNKILRFNDPRRFGAILWTKNANQHPLISVLGPEPLSDDFSDEYLFQHSRKRTSNVKSFIMDSHVVVGVGNIYANESLFMSGIHPKRAANRISAKRYQRLTDNIKQVLTAAIEKGGTTLKDFTQSDGKPGYFKQSLAVYGREGALCLKCKSPIKQIKLGQRSTFYCPQCQK